MKTFSTRHLPPPASSSSLSSDRPDFIDATYAIQLARQYSFPEVLKRALYEVLSSAVFWRELNSAISSKCPRNCGVLGPLSMAGKDLYRLVSARERLCVRWRDFVMEVLKGTRYVSQRSAYGNGIQWWCQESEETRKERWRSFVFEKGGLEVVDPVRYAFVAEWGTELRENKKWCQGCLERKTWEEKRVQGWSEMDKIFGL